MIKETYIESKNNSRIREYKRLKEKKHRMKEGLYLVEGFRLLEEAFKAGRHVHVVLYEKGKEMEFSRYIEPYAENTDVIVTEKDVLRELSSTVHPQGVIGILTLEDGSSEEISLSDTSTGLLIYLDGLQDPGNLGTIIRSAHASGAKGIILGKNTVDPFNEKVIRSSMGSIFYLPIYLEGEKTLDQFISAGYHLAVTSLKAQKNLYHEDLTGKMIIAIGNEGSGVTEEVEEKADLLLKIPMPGGAESLNAAVAASIVLFERVRQLESDILK